jgi:hypothetical protein
MTFYESIKTELSTSVFERAVLYPAHYDYDLFLDDAILTEERRCQVVIGRGLLALWNPTDGDAIAWTVDEVDNVEGLKGGLFANPAVIITMATGHVVMLRSRLSGSKSARVTKAVTQASRGMRALPAFSALEPFLRAERGLAERVAARKAAAEDGRLIPWDLEQALGEEAIEHGMCVCLGVAAPPAEPEGPAFRAFAIAGPTRFGFLPRPIDPWEPKLACWHRINYDEVELVGYRAEEEAGSWLVEIVTKPKRIETVNLNLPNHYAVRLPAPATLGKPNVTDAILTRLRGQIVPEAKAAEMVLLPITQSPSIDSEAGPSDEQDQ